MRTRFCCLAVAATLTAATIGGCVRHGVNTVEREDPIGTPDPVAAKKVIPDGRLNKVVRVEGVRQARTPADVLQVQVDLFNTRQEDHRFSYMFEWYDMNGILVDTPLSHWRTMQIAARERQSLVGVAPTPSAMDFRLKLRDPKDD